MCYQRLGMAHKFERDTYVVHNAVVRIAESSDEKLIPERSAVGFVVEEADSAISARCNSFANDID